MVPLAAKPCGRGVGQGQVHVVAAQQDVVADRHAGQHQLARLLADGDQRQVGGAAAHVADQHHVADLDLLAPLVVAGVDPGIKGGLRLLQQGDVLQAGGAGRLDGQLAGHGVERGRHRQDDVLLLQPVLGHVLGDQVVPGLGTGACR